MFVCQELSAADQSRRLSSQQRLCEEHELLSAALRQVAELVVEDAERPADEADGDAQLPVTVQSTAIVR